MGLEPTTCTLQAVLEPVIACRAFRHMRVQPDVILARSTPATAALTVETRTIPIVFTTVSDPIGSGFVANFARPGDLAFAISGSGNSPNVLKALRVAKQAGLQTANIRLVYFRSYQFATYTESVWILGLDGKFRLL